MGDKSGVFNLFVCFFNSNNWHVWSKTQHMKLSHLPPTLPFVWGFFFFFFPCSSCITRYFVQPLISSLLGDPLWPGIGAACLGLAGGARGSRRAVTAEVKALSFLGTTFPSSLTLPARRHCYTPRHGMQSKMVDSSAVS